MNKNFSLEDVIETYKYVSTIVTDDCTQSGVDIFVCELLNISMDKLMEL